MFMKDVSGVAGNTSAYDCGLSFQSVIKIFTFADTSNVYNLKKSQKAKYPGPEIDYWIRYHTLHVVPITCMSQRSVPFPADRIKGSLTNILDL